MCEEPDKKAFKSDIPGPSKKLIGNEDIHDEEMHSLEPIEEDEPDYTIAKPSFKITNIDATLAKLYLKNDYPSVTTILKPFYTSVFGIHQKSDELMQRGKEIHGYCSLFLRSKNVVPAVMHQGLFDLLVKEMRKFDGVFSVESEVYSPTHKYKGRLDSIVFYK